MMGPRNLESQGGKKTNAADDSTSSNNMTGPIQFNNPQVDVHTIGGKLLVKYEVKWIT